MHRCRDAHVRAVRDSPLTAILKQRVGLDIKSNGADDVEENCNVLG